MLEANEKDIDKISETFYLLVNGKTPKPIELPPDHPNNEIKQAVGYINRFIDQYGVFADFIANLSVGDLDFASPKGGLNVLQSSKNLHANLRHLTWKTQQISGGDFDQRVDFMGDFSVAFNSMARQLKEAFEKIESQNAQLAEANEIINAEKEKSDKLLLNILPVRVAEDLKQTGRTMPRAFDNVTVFFSDIVGFTKTSSKLDPRFLIDELNEIFTAFDNIIEEHGGERIKTIGDAYLAVCGMPEPDENHAIKIVSAALEMLGYLEDRNAESKVKWEIRIGVHSGSVVGGVVGVKKYIYDIFGDTINTASRMESSSEPMRINVSEATRDLIQGNFDLEERAANEVKGKGRMKMYFVNEQTKNLR